MGGGSEQDLSLRGVGKGSTIAAWKQAARAELARASGEDYVQILLDLVKAFERIPYRVLLREAKRLGYPLRLLRLAIATYRLSRSVRVGDAMSDLVVAIRGIVAGSGTATTEMRIVMVDIVDAALTFCPHVVPTLFVDDLALEHSGKDRQELTTTIANFTKAVMRRISDDSMEVNLVKSLVSASKPSIAAEVVGALGDSKLTISHRVKSLGVGLAAGTARNVRVQNSRLKKFKQRLPRFRLLRRAGVDTAKVYRTGGGAAVMHGSHTNGVSPSMLLSQRRAATAATAPGSGFGGQDLEIAMMIADGKVKGKADPAFAAHADVVGHWAKAVWNSWLAIDSLQMSLQDAKRRVANAKRPWSIVYGPAAGLVCTLDRVGWTIESASSIVSDIGTRFDLTEDPPIVIERSMNESVRRWRWRNVAEKNASMPDIGANWGPIAKLLESKRCDCEWNPMLRGSLKSALANR